MIMPEQKNHRVLIIDDELGPRESLRILLKKEFDVLTADSVQRGLELLREHNPDVVVSDIRMPGVNGIEGLKRIREINSDVPVIMLTGYGALETAQEAIRLGANDYMKKPFDATDMLEIIRRNVERAELIRRREQSRQTLEQLNRQLLEEMNKTNRLAALGQASAELVHDLRNPMMIILGYVQLLAQDITGSTPPPAANNGETVEYVEAIESNVRRCKDLIESWLDLSRNNRMTLVPMNLSALVGDVLDAVRPLAQTKQVRVESQLPAEAVAILGNAVQLRRALQNLVVNALDALHETSGMIRIACTVNHDAVELTIADNGEGIAQQHLPHIFKPFYSSKGSGKGTGLGLFITQKIIEDHHGSIAIESSPGCGTSAIVRLPALKAQATEIPAAPADMPNQA